jgi:TorA maturation chaperone TorD
MTQAGGVSDSRATGGEGARRPPERPDPRKLRLLGALLSAPAEDSLSLLAELVGEETWLADAVAELRLVPLAEWQAEHTRLFVNAQPRTVCPPFASAYRQGEMRGAAAGEIAGFYADVGLVAAGGLPPDYVGTLLECAAYLMDSGVDPAQQWRRLLWERHLMPWVPRFASDLRQHAALRLYRDLGAQLAGLF